MRARTFVSILTLLVVGGMCLPCGHAGPDDAWSLAARVPATALGYVALEDVGAWEARLEQTAIHKLLSHPDMQAFLKPLMKMAEDLSAGQGPMQEMPAPVQEFIQQLQHVKGDLALAVLDIDRSSGMPSLVASLDFGGHAKEFGQFLSRFRKEVDPNGERIRESVHNGRMYWHIDAQGMPVTATIFDSALVIGSSQDVVDSVIGGEVDASLASTSAFAKVHKQAGGDDLALFAYANVPPIVEMVAGEMGRRERAMANSLGLDTIQAAALGIAFAGDGFRDSLILHAPNAKHGFLSLIRYEPFENEALKWVPANAFYYAEGKANLDVYLDNIRRFSEAMEPGSSAQMDEMIQQLSTSLGVDLEKDLVKQLAGNTCMYAGLPSTGGLYPEVALMLKAKDGGQFEGALKRLFAGIGGMITEEGEALATSREIAFQNHTLHLLELEGPRRNRMVPFTPTWARIADQWFAFTLVPHTMKELLLHVNGTSEGGLAQQEDFQAVMAQRPRESGSVGYLDLQALMTILYDTGVPLLQTLAKPNMLPREFPPLDFALLPPTRTIRKYFRSMGIFATWNDDGVSISTQGPIPMGVVVGGAMMLAAVGGMTRMAPRRARSMRVVRPTAPHLDDIQRDVAEMQARELARHVHAFVLKHDVLPTSLDQLIEKEIVRTVPSDPWGNRFSLVVTNAASKTFKLLSAGPDGQRGTKDDILVDG